MDINDESRNEAEENTDTNKLCETAEAGSEGEEKPKSKDEKIKNIVDEIMSWVWTIVCAVLVAMFITHVLIVNANVPTGSMENTIMTGDKIVANRLAYKFSDPERYDIVVFKNPDDESVLFVKRIIGMPGETIEVKDGKVYVDGVEEPLRDDFIKEPMINVDFGPYEVPEGCYFMMGDNRNHSSDSRMWVNKFVKREKILGKVVFRYFPNAAYLADK